MNEREQIDKARKAASDDANYVKQFLPDDGSMRSRMDVDDKDVYELAARLRDAARSVDVMARKYEDALRILKDYYDRDADEMAADDINDNRCHCGMCYELRDFLGPHGF